MAIDAQSAFIKALQTQVGDLTTALGGDDAVAAVLYALTPVGGVGGSSRAGSPSGGGGGGAGALDAAHSAVPLNITPAPSGVPPRPAATGTPAEDVWGDPAVWTAVTSPPRPPGIPLLPLHTAPTAAVTPPASASAAAPPAAAPTTPTGGAPGSARGSVRATRRGSLTNAAAEATSVAQLLELASLREEVATLRKAREAEAEELAARVDEVAAVTALLKAREEDVARLRSEGAAASAAATAEGARAATATALAALHAFTCTVCAGHPFADVVDVGGAGVVHEQSCFAAQQAEAARVRVESRAAVLQAEVDSLKTFIAESREEAAAAVAAATAAATAAAATAAATAAAAAAAVPPAAPPTQRREVVDVTVMADLQGKLSALIHVHRQLLRKYAVVDVECGELAEALRGRDARIAELGKAALTHNATVRTVRETYEAKFLELQREHNAQILALRKELMSTHGHARRRNSLLRKKAGSAMSLAAEGDEVATARSMSGLPPPPPLLSGGGGGWHAPTTGTGIDGSPASHVSGAELPEALVLPSSSGLLPIVTAAGESEEDDASVDGGDAATSPAARTRNVVKPLRGHHGRGASAGNSAAMMAAAAAGAVDEADAGATAAAVRGESPPLAGEAATAAALIMSPASGVARRLQQLESSGTTAP